jgi:hypothetical protein
MTRQGRFGGMLDHGHEAAFCRNENKTLPVLQHVTHVAEDLPKRCCCSTFRAWAVLTRLQSLSENATVCNSVALALFVTKLQALGSKIIRLAVATKPKPWLFFNM